MSMVEHVSWLCGVITDFPNESDKQSETRQGPNVWSWLD